MAKQHTKVLEEWFDRVWRQRDASAIHEMYVADGPVHGLGDQPMVGPEDFEQFHAAICRLLDETHVQIEKSLESGKWVSALCTLHGRARTTGGEISISGNVWARVKEVDVEAVEAEGDPESKKDKKGKKKKSKKKKKGKDRSTRYVMTEAYNHWEFISLFEQLGLLPPETMSRGLLGQKTV